MLQQGMVIKKFFARQQVMVLIWPVKKFPICPRPGSQNALLQGILKNFDHDLLEHAWLTDLRSTDWHPYCPALRKSPKSRKKFKSSSLSSQTLPKTVQTGSASQITNVDQTRDFFLTMPF
jgi:hypothetical protein